MKKKTNRKVKGANKFLKVALGFLAVAAAAAGVAMAGQHYGWFEKAPAGSSSGECEHEYSVFEITKEATCKEKGIKTYTCELCGEAKEEDLPLLAHTESILEAVAPTCTEKGLTEGKICTVCEEVLEAQEEVPAAGHNPVVDEAVPATCETDGLSEGAHCEGCGVIYAEQSVIPAMGHNVIEDVEAYDPTCTEKGFTGGGKCERCDYVTSGAMIDALGHSFEQTEVVRESTCTVAGEAIYTCTTCGGTETRELELAGHDFINGICGDCGSYGSVVGDEVSVAVDGGILRVHYLSGGGCAVSQFNQGVAVTEELYDVIIPSVIDNRPVLGIYSYAFSNGFASACNVKSITIGEYVKYIGSHCFEELDSLETVTFKGGALEIGEWAFYNCQNLKTVTFEGASASSNAQYKIGDMAFYSCFNLKSVTIPRGFTEIGDQAFQMTAIEAVTIPDTVVSIGYKAFSGSLLKSIVIGKEVAEIGEDAFNNCFNLETIFNRSSLELVAGSDAYGGLAKYATTIYANNAA